MRRLANHFLRGLAITAPLALTIFIIWQVFVTVDRWLHLSVPGLGFLIAVATITLIGMLGSGLLTRGLVAALEELLAKVPLVRLVYSSFRDLIDAFVGERRRFRRAVSVALSEDGAIKAIGFVTRETMEQFGLQDHVAVYLPLSYSFAGHLVMVPASRVSPLAFEGADAMAFVVSGGVADSARTSGT
ncbi:MAG TPA: DUF502 domain-containing protein [Gemmatimonadales bacterium]|nr:DUF502 domain-containing protein [Gemmatimonadales bacterium]